MSLRIGRWGVLGFTGMCLLIGASVSPAATNYVAKYGLDSAAGSQAAPWRTIQWGVTNIFAGDSLYVGEGTYNESVNNPQYLAVLTHTNNNITLIGGWNTNGWIWDPKNHPTIINPANAGLNVLTISPNNNTIIGFTLTGGLVGLLFNQSHQQGFIANCIISNNASDGIYETGDMNIQAKNCLIVKNGGNGLKRYMGSDPADNLANCTIAYNGLNALNDISNYNELFYLTNCIVAFNSGAGLINNSGGSFGSEASSSCIFSNAAGNLRTTVLVDSGVIVADPKFVNAAASDFHLQNGSPCVGYGKDLTGNGVTNDLENTARTAPFDMGCYQSANTPLVHYPATYADAGIGSDANLGNGPGAGAAKKTIGAALAVIAAQGTCNVAAGTYPEMVIVPYYGITLQGAGQDSTTITNPSGNWTAVYMYESNIVLRGFTVVGNNAGYGVSIGGPDPSLGQGGVGPSACADVIDQCTIRNANNGVQSIYDYFQVLTAKGVQQHKLNRCIITSNLVSGIYVYDQGVRATNCLVVYNGANGVQVFQGNAGCRAYFFYCTIASNGNNGYYATTASGQDSQANCLTNCIVTGNGSIGINKISPNANTLYVNYSIVSGQPANFGGAGGASIVIQANVITNQVPTFTRGFKLADGSAGIDVGINIGVTVDLIGGVRPFGAGYDMGAYEFIRPPRGTIFMTR